MAERDDTSIWKTEISFRRKRKKPETVASPESAASPEKTSIWKKEITLGRKRGQPKQEETVARAPAPPAPASVAPPVATEPLLTLPPRSLSESAPAEPAPAPRLEPEPVPRAPEKTSIWKKEITLGRKRAQPKQEETIAPAPLPPPQPPLTPASVAPPEPSLTVPPLTPSDSAPAEPVATPAPVPRAPEKTSIWKKEITLGRKREQPEREPAAAQPEKTSIWKKEITLGRKRADPKPEVKGVPVPAPVPSPPKPESVAELLRPSAETAATPADEPETSFTLPPLSPAESAPAEPAPTPDKTSIWKKEITLGRKREQPEPAAAGEAAPEKTSIWKKEITLGRTRAAPKPDETVPAPLPAPPTPEPVGIGEPDVLPATPPVEREPSFTLPPLSLSDSTPVESPPVCSPALEPEPVPREPEKTSIWKKEITLGRKHGQLEPAPASDPAPEKTSIWKKEITLGRKRAEPKPQEKGVAVPAPLPPPPKPDSVADLLRPVAGAAPATPAPPAPEPPADPALPLPPVSPSENIVVEPLPPLVSPLPSAGAPPAAAPPPAPPPPVFAPTPVLEEAQIESAPAGEQNDTEDKEQPSTSERREPEPDEKRAKPARKTAKKPADRDPAVRRHKRLVGLKIGGSQIAAAEVLNNGTPRLNKIARAGLERGVIVGGEVREVEELAAALKTFFRENKLPRKSVRLGISNNRIGVRTFEISGIDDAKQLANAIRFRAQETLPIPLDEAVLDYRILKDSIGEDGVRTRRVLLVVAHRDLVDRYVSACTKAGLRLVGIDLEAFALLRALGAADFEQAAGKDAGLVVVSLGFDRSTLAVSDGRICEFTRVIPWGGSSLDVAVARTLDLTPSEAEPVKRRISLLDEGDGAGLEAARADAVRQALRAEVQTFARELVASLRYYQEQPESLGIGEIVIAGGTSQCHGLAEELSRIIGVTVRPGDPLVRLKTSRRLRKRLEDGVGSFATAVGLGIED